MSAARRFRPSRARFRRLVDDALEILPERFRAAQDNVVVVVESRPGAGDRARTAGPRAAGSPRLFGIYRGVPLPERGSGYHLAPPDVIAVFRRPLLRACRTRKRLRREIDLTVLHEFGHFFGLDERAVEHL